MAFFKNLLKRRPAKHATNETMDFITFNDLQGQMLILDTMQVGNTDGIVLTNKDNSFNVVLNSEQAIVLASVLEDFYATNNINNSIKIFRSNIK